tara:strand:+ start:521 stop:784 length:264 start_codon:yes stop_codon:yes gene_type:complete
MESEMRSAKLKNILAGAAGFVALAVASTPAAQAQEDYIAKWKEFAAETGLPEHQAWADMLDNDETRALEKAWSDYRGYTATSLIEGS